jgi:hypothetical protein
VSPGASGHRFRRARLAQHTAVAAVALAVLSSCGGGPSEPRIERTGGDNQEGFAGNYARQPLSIRLVDEQGDPVPNTAVTFAVTDGGGIVVGGSTPTNGAGEAALTSWRFGASGTQAVTASALGISTTFTANAIAVPPSAFNIEVRFLGTPPSPAVQQALAASAARWAQVIVGDLEDIVLTGNERIGPIEINTGIPNVGTITCVPLLENQTIDDMVIFADIRPIDGTSGSNILGFALPVVSRSDFTTVAGCMVFDEDNLAELEASGRLGDLILHEMAHVIGFGSIWSDFGYLVGGCPVASPLPSFAGPSARQAFFGTITGAFAGAAVPVEGDGACGGGTRDSHWRESVFDTELMTGFIEVSGPNPLSAITAASLRDLGYEVNDGAADPFSLLRTDAAVARAPGRRIELVEPRIDARPVIVDERGRSIR